MTKGTELIIEKDATSSLVEGTSGDAKTFTQTDVDAMVAKARSDALAAAGRDAKGLSETKKTVDAAVASAQQLLERAEARQAEIDQRELEAVRDDPDRFQLIKERQLIRAERAALEKEKAIKASEDAKIISELEEGRQTKRQMAINAIATEHGIDSEKLGDLIDDSMSIERVRKIALALPKVVRETSQSDKGETQGGVAQTEMQIKQDYITGKINMTERMNKLIAIGVNPFPS